MKNLLWASFLVSILLAGCGGGGGNPGTCSGSAVYCAESAGGAASPGATGGPTFNDLFTMSGAGDAVFDIPARVTRIRIQASSNATISTFFVDIAGKSVVITSLGITRNPVAFDGTYIIAGGTVAITGASGVSWTFTEVAADNSSPSSSLFAKSGSGDAVFDIPARVTRIRIQASSNATISTFFVDIAGKSVVITSLGTTRNPVAFDETYIIAGGTAAITGANGVTWTFTEVQ